MRKRLTINKNITMNITFEVGFNDFLDRCKIMNLREATIKHYKESYKSIIRYLDKDIMIKDITINTVNNFILKCKENPNIGETSLYTYLRDLKTILRYFMQKEYLKSFPIALTKVDKKPITPYTNEEIKKLIRKPNLKKCSFTEYRDYCIVCFLLSTGVRLSSLINIKIEDIDLDNCLAKIMHTKNRKPLIIPLNSSIVKVLKEWLKYRQHESVKEHLFCTVFGGKLTSSALIQTINNYNKSRGISTTGIHRFRHTFAKQWVINGGNVVTLSKILGHSNLNITQNYINVLVSDIQKEVEEIDILNRFSKDHIKLGK